jgi:hypothetical protein
MRSVRSWAGRNSYRLLHPDPVDIGGHFAAWDGPELASVDARGTVAAADWGHL